jgi:monovalent cation:H+ antiporter, CPA1 family
MGNFGSRRSMSATTRLAVDSFWEYAAFIAESLVFLLIGMQIKFPLVVKYLPFIGAGIVAILLARIVIVYALIPLVSDRKHPIPFTWRHLLFWGGLRGSLCMAMALSLPSNFPEREMLVVTTFGVALFTLLVPGLSMESLVRVLKVSGVRAPRATQLLDKIVKLQSDKRNLHKAMKTAQLSKKEYRAKEKEIDAQLLETEQILELLDNSENSDDDVERLHIETALIKAQRDCLVHLARKDLAKPEVLEVFRERIDSRYLELRGEAQAQEASQENDILPK